MKLNFFFAVGTYSHVLHIMFFFRADADVRLARRIRRDTAEKSRDIAMVLDQVSFSCAH